MSCFIASCPKAFPLVPPWVPLWSLPGASQVTHFGNGALISRQLVHVRGRRQQTFEGALAFVQQPGAASPWGFYLATLTRGPGEPRGPTSGSWSAGPSSILDQLLDWRNFGTVMTRYDEAHPNKTWDSAKDSLHFLRYDIYYTALIAKWLVDAKHQVLRFSIPVQLVGGYKPSTKKLL